MHKHLSVILLLLVLALLGTRTARAQTVSQPSAELVIPEYHSPYDYRVENLRDFFEKYNSPLVDYAENFVACADQNNIDYRLVPAITGVESTFGKHIPEGSYNAYGWANGEYTFESWEDSIAHVSEILKTKYIDKGAESVYEIARIYAPPSTTWGKNVAYFMTKIDTLPLSFDI